jgi:hypothetical protein
VTADKNRSPFQIRRLSTALICQVAGIGLATVALLPIVAFAILAYAASRWEWLGPIVFDYDDPYNVIHLAGYILPPCLWWWLYTKTMRGIAQQLNLTRARKELGIPFTGEIEFVAGLFGRP